MTKAKIIHWAMLAVILAVCYATIYYQTKVISSGQTVYVPLIKGQPFTTTDQGLELNFKSLITGKQELPASGTIVIYVNSFGVVSFVRMADDKKNVNSLAFGEHFLNYYTYRQAGIYPVNKPKIFFGARYLQLPESEISQHSSQLARARYLVLKLSESGFAVPIGLADRNYGSILRIYK